MARTTATKHDTVKSLHCRQLALASWQRLCSAIYYLSVWAVNVKQYTWCWSVTAHHDLNLCVCCSGSWRFCRQSVDIRAALHIITHAYVGCKVSWACRIILAVGTFKDSSDTHRDIRIWSKVLFIVAMAACFDWADWNTGRLKFHVGLLSQISSLNMMYGAFSRDQPHIEKSRSASSVLLMGFLPCA